MELERWVGGCKGFCLQGFGGGEAGESPDRCDSKEKILEKFPKLMAKELGQGWKTRPGIIFANTTSNQPGAIEALTELGFYTQKEPSPLADGRTIQGWFLPINEYEK